MNKQIITTIISLFFVINFNLVAQSYSGGSGTQADPYLISTRLDMAALATAVNGGNKYSGKYFLLTEDLTNISTVIGNSSSNYFGGVFDGGGYNITVNINVNVSVDAYVGVFGSISGAVLKNLSINGIVTSISGRTSYTGGICGYASNSTISNCYNIGNISSSTLPSSGSSSYAGGICGYASNLTISNCYNTGNISSTTSAAFCYAGGICGTANKIIGCFTANTSITSISGSGLSSYNFIGRISGNSNCTIEMCYALSSMLVNSATISSQSPSSYQGANATMSNFQSQTWIEDNLFFWDFVNTWYIPASTSALPILKKEPFLKFALNPANITYGDMQQMTLSATSKNTREPIVFKSSNNAIAEVIGNTLQIKKAGTVTITASQAGLYEYKSDSMPQILTIAKKTLIIKADDCSMIYGDNTPQYTVSYNGFVLGENQNNLINLPTITCNATATSNVGTYTITPSGAQSDNYTFTYQTGKLTIQKRSLNVIPNDASRTYGSNNPTFTFSYQGFVNGNTEYNISVKPTAITTANIWSDVGNYPITCYGGNATNYEFIYGEGILRIIKAPLTIRANNTTRPQGQPNPTWSMSYSGFKNGNDYLVLDNLPIVNCTADENSPAGNYDIVLLDGNDNNYAYTLINGTLTVTVINAVENIYVQNLEIYPNPVKDELRIKNEDLAIRKIEIIDLSGKVILQFNNFKNQINVLELSHGFYFVKLETDKGVVTKKFVKE